MYWQILGKLPDGENTYVICECESPEKVAAVIAAILGASKSPPAWLAIEARVR